MVERRANRTTAELRRELRELTARQRFERRLASSRMALRIGGWALPVHGAGRTTFDVDVAPAPDRANLD